MHYSARSASYCATTAPNNNPTCQAVFPCGTVSSAPTTKRDQQGQLWASFGHHAFSPECPLLRLDRQSLPVRCRPPSRRSMRRVLNVGLWRAVLARLRISPGMGEIDGTVPNAVPRKLTIRVSCYEASTFGPLQRILVIGFRALRVTRCFLSCPGAKRRPAIAMRDRRSRAGVGSCFLIRTSQRVAPK